MRGAVAAFALIAALVPAAAQTAGNETVPATIQFKSLDGTMLTGYLFRPARTNAAPAIVMMHGRAGAYSSAARGRYDASTLTMRHKAWGAYWARQGYVALMVDGFGPRGYPAGFPRFSYGDRPEAVNEVTLRPLDAYGALQYLRGLPGIDGHQIALQGWSNGGSATLAALSDETLAAQGLRPGDGFKGAVAFYPACGLHNRFDKRYLPYAPLRVFSGGADEEVSAARCERLIAGARRIGANASIEIYPGADHSFDDPGAKRQANAANAAAAEHAVAAASLFMRELFGR